MIKTTLTQEQKEEIVYLFSLGDVLGIEKLMGHVGLTGKISDGIHTLKHLNSILDINSWQLSKKHKYTLNDKVIKTLENEYIKLKNKLLNDLGIDLEEGVWKKIPHL